MKAELQKTVRVLQSKNLQEQPQNTSLQIANNLSISVYNDILTAKNVSIEMSRIKKCFPNLPIGFYDILMERIKEKRFTDQRLKDSVNNLIDNFTFPQPTVANILSWDKRIKLYTYQQLTEFVNEFGESVFENYKAIELPGVEKRVYASVIDIGTYNLKLK